MDNFISTVIFTLPGLLCYYWLQWLGFTSSQKHTVFEMAGISALLWIPVSGMTLIFYNLNILILNILFIINNNRHFSFITNLNDLKEAFTKFCFILFFCIGSILFSYLFARMWVEYIYSRFLDHINEIRINKLKIGKLSKKPTVWEEIFTVKGPKVVKIVKLDKPEEFIIGSIRKASRPLEPERHLALDEVDYFTKLIEKYNPTIKHVFIDTKAGIVIHMYNPKSINDIQNNDNNSDNPIISPWSDDLDS
jgi:hypothetical protein